MALLLTVLTLVLVEACAVAWFESDCDRHGHAWMLQLADDRLYLICTVCETESPGWAVGP